MKNVKKTIQNFTWNVVPRVYVEKNAILIRWNKYEIIISRWKNV